MPSTPPFVTLVSAAHRRLSHSPVYHGRLFPVERYFPQAAEPASPPAASDSAPSSSSSSSVSPALLTLPILTSEINKLSSFYQQRCDDIRAHLDAVKADLFPPLCEGSASLVPSFALCFSLLLQAQSSALYELILTDDMKLKTEAALSSAAAAGVDISAVALQQEGMTVHTLNQLRALLSVSEEVDMLRTFCLTSSVQAFAALSLLDAPPSTAASPLLSSPFALSHHLTDIAATIAALLDSFLPRRPSPPAVCLLSSCDFTLPVRLSSCGHRFELTALLKPELQQEERCPLCCRTVDLQDDSLTAESVMLKLDSREPADEQQQTVSPPQPVASPVLTLSELSSSSPLNGVSSAKTLALGIQQRLQHFLPAELPAASLLSSGAEDEAEDARGVSCHQCKSNKPKHLLLFCTTKADGLGRKRKCRKKYCQCSATLAQPASARSCHSSSSHSLSSSSASLLLLCSGDACLRRSYSQSISSMTADDLLRWQCPSCTSQCTCAACIRRSTRPADSTDFPLSTAASPSSSSSSSAASSLASSATVSPSAHASASGPSSSSALQSASSLRKLVPSSAFNLPSSSSVGNSLPPSSAFSSSSLLLQGHSFPLAMSGMSVASLRSGGPHLPGFAPWQMMAAGGQQLQIPITVAPAPYQTAFSGFPFPPFVQAVPGGGFTMSRAGGQPPAAVLLNGALTAFSGLSSPPRTVKAVEEVRAGDVAGRGGDASGPGQSGAVIAVSRENGFNGGSGSDGSDNGSREAADAGGGNRIAATAS